MIHYVKQNNYLNGESFKYILVEKKVYLMDRDLGDWELISPDNMLMVKCVGKTIVVYPGYMWNGTSFIGNVYEDDVTLESSLIHNVLYNAIKNPKNEKVNFGLFYADWVFYYFLKRLYMRKGSQTFKKFFISNLYITYLFTFGLMWKIGKNNYYNIKKVS